MPKTRSGTPTAQCRYVNAIEHSARISSYLRSPGSTDGMEPHQQCRECHRYGYASTRCLSTPYARISVTTFHFTQAYVQLCTTSKNLLVHPSIRNSRVSAMYPYLHYVLHYTFVGGDQDLKKKGVHTQYEYNNICV